MKLDILDIFDLTEVDEPQTDLIYRIGRKHEMKSVDTQLDNTLQEIYRDRLSGEGAEDFVAQSTFLAEAYKTNGLYHEAADIYRKLLVANPKNKKFRQALEEITISLN
ncbi:MAG: hypothetical protein A3I75_01165 [Deltaproteobacteria bacterium RIFCSPLOWO2_02_FULL_50_16]|nr:MAG: hypothetical protein A3B79_03335 [Deltaproteobacteria bacterium RIFCSPHIGHO2_02_FULL_50_15]OGQ58373.1 MAG: hypothetical protein A3I75_01165 [Deltaproteobacteria bacterium RIFCSPLOWO2_02_FULL_50_16]OGQ68515.1 MAG: hypothetical protein A3F89_00385 [Deltaproteobacteria bacterium RIFCSPLOWO2_12_FULL_50_11]